MTKKKLNESTGQRFTRRPFQMAETVKKKACALTVTSLFGGTEEKPVQS